MVERLLDRLGPAGTTLLATIASCLLAGLLLAGFDILFKGEIIKLDLVIAVLIALVVVPLVTHFFVSLAFRLKDATNELEWLANYDYLTGILNRRAFMERTRYELRRAQRYDHPVSILIMDIDRFKKVNDEHGHAVGDDILVSFTRCCSAQLRENDVFARYGGEEFVVLLPESDQEKGLEAAKRIGNAVEKREMKCRELTLEITVSIGVATAKPHAARAADAELDVLLKSADRALYTAKQSGRNRAVVAREGFSSTTWQPHPRQEGQPSLRYRSARTLPLEP